MVKPATSHKYIIDVTSGKVEITPPHSIFNLPGYISYLT